MCEIPNRNSRSGLKTISVDEAVGTILAHDITEIRPGEFKGRAFKKGHVVRKEDICHLQRLGKEHLFVLTIADDEMHEDDAAYALAYALKGEGISIEGEPREGKINLVAEIDGLLKINHEALFKFNMIDDVMCATLHTNTVVKKGQTVAGTRVIPLVVKRAVVDEAVRIAENVRQSKWSGIIEVRKMRKPKAGIVITGNEVYYGRIKDSFAPIITGKLEAFSSEIVGIYYAPDDESFIEARLRELIDAGANLLITTGGMSVDPDDVTRFAIRKLGATHITYGTAVLPGAMFLIAYLDNTNNSEAIPILGIPACGLFCKTTVFDLMLPRVLAGEKIEKRQLSELGHGGLCLKCEVCYYPVCPFGK